MKIQVSPEVARFNQAVEAADRALVNCASEVTDPDRIVALLMWAGEYNVGQELTHALNLLEGKRS